MSLDGDADCQKNSKSEEDWSEDLTQLNNRAEHSTSKYMKRAHHKEGEKVKHVSNTEEGQEMIEYALHTPNNERLSAL